MVENGIFHCLVEERKQERQKIKRKIFPSDPPFFILPVWEENGERKVLKDTLYTNTLNLFISPTPHFIHLTCDLITFASSSLSLYLHSIATSRFSFFFFFFFFNECKFANHVFAAQLNY